MVASVYFRTAPLAANVMRDSRGAPGERATRPSPSPDRLLHRSSCYLHPRTAHRDRAQEVMPWQIVWPR
jgi:hypothetical protein